MDEFAKRLRDDAGRIDCEISEQLDGRIRASLENIKPETAAADRQPTRSPLFWLASTLTGVAAAAVLIVGINLAPPEPAPAVTEPAPQAIVIPAIKWRAETAVLTSPLEQEMEDLQSDLKKAEEAVMQDIERLF